MQIETDAEGVESCFTYDEYGKGSCGWRSALAPLSRQSTVPPRERHERSWGSGAYELIHRWPSHRLSVAGEMVCAGVRWCHLGGVFAADQRKGGDLCFNAHRCQVPALTRPYLF